MGGLEVAFGFAQLAEPEAESLSHKAFLSLKALEADVPSALVKLEEGEKSKRLRRSDPKGSKKAPVNDEL